MLNKIDYVLSKILEVIMTVSLFLTVLITFIQVIFRYIFNMSSPWTQDVLMICFIYSIFFGAAILVYKKEHLVVDLFDNLSAMKEKLLKTLEFIVAVFFLSILIYFGIDLVEKNLISGQTLGVLPFKQAYLYLAIPSSSVFMIYFYIRRLFKIWFG